ncbi:hypothetical protein HELRODRAFT_66826, partial [Helobdella robusta]|uniref:N-acetylgalactosaminide beta-1,3-galactosyltransferase n=1 Tax=Helobdella robusta TaxID=6412 RepID=T1FYR7_HELRO
LAEKLYDEIRILCWIMTSPLTIQLRAKHISETWGKHCNKVLFMSSENDTHLPAIGLNINEGYDFLWNKTKAAFKYIYTNHLNDADWFVKADDDTYMNIENLRYLITQLKEKSSSYLGRRFKFFFPAGYMSGGAGYVLSKSALHKFVRQGLKAKYSAFCKAEPGGYEDVNMGQCLKYSNIMPIDTRDEKNMERFHPYPPYFILTDLFLDKDDWIFNYSYYPWKTGPPCCSTTTISFHYMLPKDMYQTHYLAYHLKPYGMNRNVTVKY